MVDPVLGPGFLMIAMAIFYGENIILVTVRDSCILYRYRSPFAGSTFLRITANGETTEKTEVRFLVFRTAHKNVLLRAKWKVVIRVHRHICCII